MSSFIQAWLTTFGAACMAILVVLWVKNLWRMFGPRRRQTPPALAVDPHVDRHRAFSGAPEQEVEPRRLTLIRGGR